MAPRAYSRFVGGSVNPIRTVQPDVGRFDVVRLAKTRGLKLRQSYERVRKFALIKH